jgi:ATP-binding cassette subfamily B protein
MVSFFKSLNSFLANIKRALKFVWEASHKLTVVSIVLVFIQGLLPLAMLYLIKLIVDAVADGLKSSDFEPAFESVVWLISAAGVVAILGGLFSILSSLVTRLHTQTVTDYMYSILHAKSLEVDLEYYENSKYYDSLYRAQKEVGTKPSAILDGLLKIGQNGITVLALAGVLWLLHWSIVLILIVTTLPELIQRLKFAGLFYSWQRKTTPKQRQAQYLNNMLTKAPHAKEIRLFELGALFQEWFKTIRDTLRLERKKLEIQHSLSMLGVQTLTNVAVFGLFIFVAHRTMNGMLGMGDLVMYFQAIQRGYSSIQTLGQGISGLYESNLFLSNLYEFLALPRKILNPPKPKAFPMPMKSGLIFDHISYSYEGANRSVVHDVSFSIQPGEHIALVGKNGAGKSTLVKLFCRLYDPTKGRITLDGVDIRDFDLTELRAQISVIFQDFIHYHMSVQDNIRFGTSSHSVDFEQIEMAAEQAGVSEVIARLPQGYQSMLGKLFDGGEELSIGEWQKIALARAFLRQSQILVLDEPTSAMDAKAEAELFERFHALAKDRMAILISHRLSTVKMVDRIYLLDQGHIVEWGTHDELMKRKGPYSELFEMQARGYR